MTAWPRLTSGGAKAWRQLRGPASRARWFTDHAGGGAGPGPSRIDFSPSRPPEATTTRFGSVAVVGYPSAGKSSLMNKIVGGRVAAVSRKVQTTRRRIVGLLTEGDTQLAFLDTPGVVERRFASDLGAERKELAREAWGAVADADLCIFMVDISRSEDHWARAAALANQVLAARPAAPPGMLLALNKMDRVRPSGRVLEAVGLFAEKIDNFADTVHEARPFVISASTGRGVDDVKRAVLELAPAGDFLMEHHSSPAEFEDLCDTVLEHIWQACLHRLHQEVPYQLRTETESWKVLPSGNIAASFVLRVARVSQVPMVVGRQGDNIRFIAEEAGASAGQVLGRQVFLRLRVAARKGGSP
jgi:GTPase